MTMWTFLYIYIAKYERFSRRLNESSKTMIDWQHLSFSVEQHDDSSHENIVVKLNTSGHVTGHVINW